MGLFFKNTALHSDLQVKMLSDASKNLHFSRGGGGGHFSVSLNFFVPGYIIDIFVYIACIIHHIDR